jgi:chitinase
VDDEPRISIDYSTTVTEGNVGTTDADFTVRLSNAYDEPVSVNFSTAEGDTDYWYWGGYYYYAPATDGVDFQGQSGTITFEPGDTEETITVPIIGDRVGEYSEIFSVDLREATGGLIVSGHAIGVIVDDEPYVYIDSTSQTEGHSGTTNLVFNVILTAAYDTDVTVDFTTMDGTATAADYQATSGTVTIPKGQTSAPITVSVKGDRLGEYDEYFYVQLTGATGAQISGSYGYGTILDDEPKITITGVSQNERNSGTTVFRFAVTLSGAYDQTVTVNFKTVDGTARAGSDYQAKTGTLTFSPGDTVKYIDIVVYGDTSKEEDEYFSIQLSGVSSNALLYYEWATGYIYNDDAKPGKGRGKNK